MAAGKDIDPRFDAAFQRGGLSGQPDAQTTPTPAPAADPAGSAAADSASDSAAAAASEPPTDVAPQSRYVDDAGALAASPAVGSGRSLARNPWIYALWVVGIAVTAGGIVGQLWSYLQFYTQPGLNVADYRLITAVQGLAPIAATVGAFFIVGALIIHALNWMRNNP